MTAKLVARAVDDLDDAPETPEQHVHLSSLDPEMRQFISRLMTGYEGAFRRMAELAENQGKRAERAEEVATRALESRIELAGMIEDLQSKRLERELAQQAAANREEERAALMRDVRSMLPLVGKQFIGVPLTGDDSHGLQDFLKALDPRQVDTLMAEGRLELSVGQRSLLVAVMQSLGKSEEKSEPKEDTNVKTEGS